MGKSTERKTTLLPCQGVDNACTLPRVLPWAMGLVAFQAIVGYMWIIIFALKLIIVQRFRGLSETHEGIY